LETPLWRTYVLADDKVSLPFNHLHQNLLRHETRVLETALGL
jgi:predicted secreted Zn-dependent protease